MKWLELHLDMNPAGIEPATELLSAYGIDSLMIDEEGDFKDFLENNHQYWDYVDDELEQKFAGVSRIKCYLSDDADGKAVLAKIRGAYGAVQTAFIEDSDWENNWREYYKPIEVGEKLVVVPEWEEIPADGRQPLRLDPGLIFGTGSHATTRMCLAALEKYCSPETTVLDLGCGSGILGIGSLVLGCKSCVGCDIDPKAPDVAMSNAALNGIGSDRFRVYAGDIIGDASLRRELGSGYQLVLANIVSDVIIPLSGYVRQFMAEGAVFICSGIIEGRQDEVSSVLQKNGFEIIAHYCEEEWHCFECR